jgi:hypothetical protein
MNGRWIVGLSLAAALLAGVAPVHGQQATITLSLDLFYDDANGDNVPDATAAGSWQLVARSSLNNNRGIAGVATKLVGVVNATGPAGSTFRAPTGSANVGGGQGFAGFQEFFSAKLWSIDTDNNASTHDMLFGQVPESPPGPQGLFYDVGQTQTPSIKASNDSANGQPAISGLATPVTWNFNDPLGDYLADSDPTDNDGEFQRGVLLAQGRFNANSLPAFVPGSSTGNVFTALGTQTNPPVVGTIQGVTTDTKTRTNLFTFAGDANLDHDVDAVQAGGQGDGQIVFANLGRSGDVLWQEGDFNGDKDCDVFQADGRGDAQILTAALGAGELPAQSLLAAPGTATATYNSDTGELKVDIGSGVGVMGFSSAGLFIPEIYATRFLPAYFGQVTPDVLGLFNAGAPLPEGPLSFDQILPPGLSASQILFGFTPIGSPSMTASVTVVPEPATIVMLSVAMLGGWRRRSRWSRADQRFKMD